MAAEIDSPAFLRSFERALVEKGKAIQLGRRLPRDGIRRVFLVGCGAPNREMAAIKYWLDKDARELETHLYFPAELVNQAPAKLGADSLVVLASHSGTTPEIVAAAQFLKDRPCRVVGITQLEDSPLAANVPEALIYGKSAHGYDAMFILAMALLAALMKEAEGWPLADKVLQSLDALPAALLDAKIANEKRATEDARLYKDDDFFMLLGSGPMHTAAYVFGVCILMEMQWMHVFTGEAAEFFHGPFEVLDQHTPVMVFLGEDPSRPEGERVIRFCRKFTERVMVYDSREFEMKGIAPEVRPLVGPFVVQAAADRMAEHLAVWHNHPLSTRRYMWKFEY